MVETIGVRRDYDAPVVIRCLYMEVVRLIAALYPLFALPFVEAKRVASLEPPPLLFLVLSTNH